MTKLVKLSACILETTLTDQASILTNGTLATGGDLTATVLFL